MPENPTPQIIDLSNLYRQQLLAREKQAASRITRYYGEIWGRLQGDIAALNAEVRLAQVQGETITENMVWRMERMQRIQRQAERELSQFAQFASEEVAALQREALEAAQRNARDLLAASFPEGAGVEIAWGVMPTEAVEQMVGFLADGSPLLDVIQGYVGEGAPAFCNQLVTGLATGLGPRESARLLRAQFGMPLSNALRITRTEQMRAYRAATLNTYRQNSHIVTKWKRMAARNDRTCMACIMLDGTIYDLASEMDDHINGRCCCVPLTVSYASLGIEAEEPGFVQETAAEWFRRQPAATQQEIMGPGMWEAWQAGEFGLEDIPKLIKNEIWGNAWVPKSLKELVGR